MQSMHGPECGHLGTVDLAMDRYKIPTNLCRAGPLPRPMHTILGHGHPHSRRRCMATGMNEVGVRQDSVRGNKAMRAWTVAVRGRRPNAVQKTRTLVNIYICIYIYIYGVIREVEMSTALGHATNQKYMYKIYRNIHSTHIRTHIYLHIYVYAPRFAHGLSTGCCWECALCILLVAVPT